MRAQFDRIHSGYHVRLQTDVAGTQTVDVPAVVGLAYQRPVGTWRTDHGMPTDTLAGFADYDWFANYIIGVMQKLNVGPDVVPLFLTDNVMLYDNGDYTSCCTIGFHGTPARPLDRGREGRQAQQTLMYSAWKTPGTYSGFIPTTSETSFPASASRCRLAACPTSTRSVTRSRSTSTIRS